MKISKKTMYLSLTFIIFILITTIIHNASYNDVINNKNGLIETLYRIPEDKINLLCFNVEVFNSLINYYSIYINYFIIFYAIYSILLAKFSFEERDKYLSFCYTIPKKRESIFNVKLIKSLAIMLMSNIIILSLNLIIFVSFKETNLLPLLTLFLATLIVEISIYSLTLLVLSFSKKETLLVPFLLLFVFIILNIVYKSTNLKLLAYVNPLSFFNYFELIKTKMLSLTYLVSFAAITIFSINFSKALYVNGDKA